MRNGTHTKMETFGDVLDMVGQVPPHRIRLVPRPGTATEADVLRLNERKNRLYELIEGVLVEKVMGLPESTLTCELIRWLGNFLASNPVGFLGGPDGAIRMLARLVRLPDISFFSWKQFPTREQPAEAIGLVVPLLAIEILSAGNTRSEMARKLREYFLAGVELVWYVDPRKRTVTVFTAPDKSRVLEEGDTLDGGDLLPGFRLPLRQLFQSYPKAAAPKRRKKR